MAMPPCQTWNMLTKSCWYTSSQKSITCSALAPMTPPMMAHMDAEYSMSATMPSRVPQRTTKYTATATAMKVNTPCHERMNPPAFTRLGLMPMPMLARVSMPIESSLFFV